MTKAQIIEWGTSKGWELDRWCHLKKTNEEGVLLRLKLGKRVVRLERGVRISNKMKWFILRSQYYSKLSIVGGKLAGLRKPY